MAERCVSVLVLFLAALHSEPVARDDVGAGRHDCCGTTTCVPGRARDASPGGTHRRSNEPGSGNHPGKARNIPAGRKNPQDFFCCVTTRRPPRGPRTAEQSFHGLDNPPVAGEPGGVVRRPPAAAAPPTDAAAAVAAWPPASDAPTCGTPDRRNTVDSSGEDGRLARIPCADRVAPGWPRSLRISYDESVPREVLSQRTARETRQSRSGTFISPAPLSLAINLSVYPAASAQSSFASRDGRRRQVRRRRRIPIRDICPGRRRKEGAAPKLAAPAGV